MDIFTNFSFYDLYLGFFNADVAIAPEYLLVTMAIAFFVYKARKLNSGFLAWVVPKKLYTHSSSFLDIKLFALYRVMDMIGFFNKVAIVTFVAGYVSGLFNNNIGSKVLSNPFMIAAIILFLHDFLTYWMHRIYHQTTVLWPIHSVHHSAEVLTPVTTYRQHPLASVISIFFHSTLFGVTQGIFLGAFTTDFSAAEIAGINVFYFLFLMLLHNFHHSHIWINFGKFWGRIFISPAQHQIHHSLAPEHHNKNYGEIFALWDWMFRSLYIPNDYEDIEVGIADAKGRRLPQRYTGIFQAIIIPLKDIIAITSRSFGGSTPPKDNKTTD